MSKRQNLLELIAETISDYRASDLPKPTPDHVDRWVGQFDSDVQLTILSEMNHVLKNTYFSLKKVAKFLESLLKTEKLVGTDPCAFWQSVKFLDIQGGGNSQREMLALFDQLLQKNCGFDIAQCGENSNTFIYLDDGLFTGNRMRRDIENWIKIDAPNEGNLHVITIALHSGGQYYAKNQITNTASNVRKNINVYWWRAVELEDRRYYTDSSDVLRPTVIPNVPEVQQYVEAMIYKPNLRTPGGLGENKLFSSEEGRNLLEQEFLKAGVRIRKLCPNLGDTQRPLGHATLETLGFGSLIVTFRNCPNNAPLALWVGDPWYPLFPRETNNDAKIRRMFENFVKDNQ